MIGAGLDQGVATWHSVILCMVLAPLGILSHALSKVSADADAPGARPAAPAGACSTCPHACALLPCRRRCGGPPARELACDADGTAAWAEKKNKNKKKNVHCRDQILVPQHFLPAQHGLAAGLLASQGRCGS